MTDADVLAPIEAPLTEAIPDTLLPVAVFGLDDTGRAHGSRFAAEEAGLATKAAGLMAMRLLPLDNPDAVALAAKLPQGWIFASGKASCRSSGGRCMTLWRPWAGLCHRRQSMQRPVPPARRPRRRPRQRVAAKPSEQPKPFARRLP